MQIQVGKKYQHFKGHVIRVVGFAKHTETQEVMVLYHCDNDDTLYARPEAMFHDPVDKTKYPEASQDHRFEPYVHPPRTVNKLNPKNRKCEYCDHWCDGRCRVSGEAKPYYSSARRCESFTWAANRTYAQDSGTAEAETDTCGTMES